MKPRFGWARRRWYNTTWKPILSLLLKRCEAPLSPRRVPVAREPSPGLWDQENLLPFLSWDIISLVLQIHNLLPAALRQEDPWKPNNSYSFASRPWTEEMWGSKQYPSHLVGIFIYLTEEMLLCWITRLNYKDSLQHGAYVTYYLCKIQKCLWILWIAKDIWPHRFWIKAYGSVVASKLPPEFSFIICLRGLRTLYRMCGQDKATYKR